TIVGRTHRLQAAARGSGLIEALAHFAQAHGWQRLTGETTHAVLTRTTGADAMLELLVSGVGLSGQNLAGRPRAILPIVIDELVDAARRHADDAEHHDVLVAHVDELGVEILGVALERVQHAVVDGRAVRVHAVAIGRPTF